MQPRIIIIMGKKTMDIFNNIVGTALIVGEISKVSLGGVEYAILPIYHPSPANLRRVLNKEIIAKNADLIRNLLKQSN